LECCVRVRDDDDDDDPTLLSLRVEEEEEEDEGEEYFTLELDWKAEQHQQANLLEFIMMMTTIRRGIIS
jgi:hypothetical protein